MNPAHPSADDTRPIAGNRKAFHDYFIERPDRGRHRAGRHRGQVAARRSRQPARQLRRDPRRRGLPHRRAHQPLRAGQRLEPRSAAAAQAAAAQATRSSACEQKINERGYTLVPTRMYFRGSRVKVEIGLARGKKQYDKRADLARRDAERDVAARPCAAATTS